MSRHIELMMLLRSVLHKGAPISKACRVGRRRLHTLRGSHRRPPPALFIHRATQHVCVGVDGR